MIHVKEAVQSARGFAEDLFPSDPHLYPITLEEVELTPDGAWWLITLGIEVPSRGLMAPAVPTQRKYKVFKVDASTGSVHSVKIREMA